MRRFLFVLFVALAGLAQPVLAELQVPISARITKSWVLPYYRSFEDGHRLLQSISEGTSATPLGKGEIMVTDFETRILRAGSQNQVQITARTPECRFNVDTLIAYSSNRIQIFSPTTNVFMQGRGFFCSQTNSLIVISNEVETFVRRSVTNVTESASNTKTTTITEETYRILSDRLELQYESNLVVYSGRVRVLQDLVQLDCDRLITRFVTNRFTTNQFTTNSVEQIIADGHVVVITPEHGRATGDHAVYTMVDGNAVIELTGHAAWTDGERESRAEKFTYNRVRHQMVADGNAVMRFPNNALSQTNLASATANRETNRLTELCARRITLQLPLTNGPIEGLLAEDDVVITNRYERSRATATRASYTKTNETFVLSGNPLCELEKGLLRGQIITYCRTNQTFKSRGDSFLKLRLDGGMLNSQFVATTNTLETTNRFLQVTARDFDYSDKLATFTEKVHTEFLQSQTVLGTLDCDTLSLVGTSNRVSAVTAKGNVRGFQPSLAGSPQRTLLCDLLTAERWPDSDWFHSASASGNVNFIQAGQSNVVRRLCANTVDATFASVSNRIEHAIAQNDVWGEQVQEGSTNAVNSVINGQRAVYTLAGTNETLELEGNPWAIYSRNTTNDVTHTNRFGLSTPQKVLARDATVLIWNFNDQSSKARGPLRITPVSDDQVAAWLKYRKPAFRSDPADTRSPKP
jgi:lipopolysaccharide export system protein LptA